MGGRPSGQRGEGGAEDAEAAREEHGAGDRHQEPDGRSGAAEAGSQATERGGSQAHGTADDSDLLNINIKPSVMNNPLFYVAILWLKRFGVPYLSTWNLIGLTLARTAPAAGDGPPSGAARAAAGEAETGHEAARPRREFEVEVEALGTRTAGGAGAGHEHLAAHAQAGN